MARGKHVTEWFIMANRLCGQHNGTGIVTSLIAKMERFEDMQMITTTSGSVYFVYDDRK